MLFRSHAPGPAAARAPRGRRVGGCVVSEISTRFFPLRYLRRYRSGKKRVLISDKTVTSGFTGDRPVLSPLCGVPAPSHGLDAVPSSRAFTPRATQVFNRSVQEGTRTHDLTVLSEISTRFFPLRYLRRYRSGKKRVLISNKTVTSGSTGDRPVFESPYWRVSPKSRP